MTLTAPLVATLIAIAGLIAPASPAAAPAVGVAVAPDLAAPLAGSTAVAPDLAAALAVAGPTERVPVVVRLRATADLEALAARPRHAHRRAVVEELRRVADTAQTPLLRFLGSARGLGAVADVRPLWIVDAVALRATPATIDRIARRPDVAAVALDATFAAPPPTPSGMATAAEPNLGQIHAPELWTLGARGDGVVVATVDTGVDPSHPDLAGRWRGGANSWFDPYGEHASPADVNGHGTWSAGVIVGGDAGGTAIGVAPGARWIAAKAFDDGGTATTSALHTIFQWLLDPDHDPATDDAPDVVHASWAYATKGCNLTFEPDLAALRAIGVLPVFAAGNGGPASSSSYSPANNPSAFSVGAVSAGDTILSYSSRGPSTCGGRGRVFPDVVAPGRDIWTSDRYGLWTTANGTSIAAPHVAGVVALLLSGKPGRTADQVAAAVTAGARDLGAAGPDNTHGAGRIDAVAAYAALP